MKYDSRTIFILFCFFMLCATPVWFTPEVRSALLEYKEAFIALTVAIVGAISGAFGAQYLNEQNQHRIALTHEMRNTNAAIITTFSIFNSVLNLRSQHIEKFRDNFYITKGNLEILFREEGPGQTISLQIPVPSLQPIAFQTETLRNLIFDKISPLSRPLALTNIIGETLDSLNLAIEQRNEMIARLQAAPQQLKVPLYLGYELPEGGVDNTYADTVDMMHSSTVDVMWFTKRLCLDLIKHAEHLKRELKDSSIRIARPLFESIDPVYLPKDERYQDWLKNFV